MPRVALSPYTLLGITPSSSIDEVRAAYKKRCLETHPDKKGGDPGEFRKVQKAYEDVSRTQTMSAAPLPTDRSRSPPRFNVSTIFSQTERLAKVEKNPELGEDPAAHSQRAEPKLGGDPAARTQRAEPELGGDPAARSQRAEPSRLGGDPAARCQRAKPSRLGSSSLSKGRAEVQRAEPSRLGGDPAARSQMAEPSRLGRDPASHAQRSEPPRLGGDPAARHGEESPGGRVLKGHLGLRLPAVEWPGHVPGCPHPRESLQRRLADESEERSRSESSSQTRRAFMRRRKALDLRDVVAVDCLRGDLAAAPAQTRTVRQLRHELESSRPARPWTAAATAAARAATAAARPRPSTCATSDSIPMFS